MAYFLSHRTGSRYYPRGYPDPSDSGVPSPWRDADQARQLIRESIERAKKSK